MEDDSVVTADERLALLRIQEGVGSSLAKFQKRVALRFLIIPAVLLVRIVTAVYFPEYHFFSVLEQDQISQDQVQFVIKARIAVAIIFGSLYLICLRLNFHFTKISFCVIVVLGGLLLNDSLTFINNIIFSLSAPSLWMYLGRFLPLSVLIINHYDARRHNIG
jgi:hypothetical protein